MLELKGCNLRFNWHECLWHNKGKIEVDFKNHYVRNAIQIQIQAVPENTFIDLSTGNILKRRNRREREK